MRSARLPAQVLPHLTDTHCHLEDPAFDLDREEVIARIRRAGMTRLLVAGSDLADSQAAARLAQAHPDLMRFAAGIHPHSADQMSPSSIDALRTLLLQPGAAAVGEIGLDYYREMSPRTTQRDAFHRQLILACDIHLPVIVHIRDAADDALDMLADLNPPRHGVWHAFSGDAAMAERALAMGFYLGAGGPITYPKAAILRDVFRAAPLDRILVETDSPYLPPEGNRGARNEPILTDAVVRRLAIERNLSADKIVTATRENANRLFGWEN
jgi:TatD DNase family protein